MSSENEASAWDRAGELLARLSIEEKAQQVTSIMPMGLVDADGRVTSPYEAALKDGIGHVAALGMFGFKSPGQVARAANSIQRFLVERTRHGIPAIIHNEALNGVVAPEFTSFPTSIGLAATWDPAGVEAMARVIARQMRAVGMQQALSPVMDLARDARWGRVHETYGEDAYLATEFSVAFTRGLQGDDLTDGVIATAKHFLGYGLSQGGQNMAAVQLGSREVYEDWARPFEAAIRKAGLASVMNSYSTIDGVPVGASRAVLTDYLRGRLGFDGTVVSDYSTVQMLVTRMAVAANAEEAGVLALSAGLDVELAGSYGYGPVLARAVRSGAVSEELLDLSARRVLRDKFALGLFENPYVDEDPIVIRGVTHDGAELARELARQSVTLLKNDDGILPLSRGTRRIAVVGPYADSAAANFAAYTYPGAAQMLRTMASGMASSMAGLDGGAMEGIIPPEAVAAMTAEFTPLFAREHEAFVRETYQAPTLAEAIRAAAPDAEVTVVAGIDGVSGDPTAVDAAVAAARDADVVVLAIGGRASWFTAGITEGEGADTADIDLPLAQQDLVKSVATAGTPMVAVLWMGRPYGLVPVIDDLQAVLTPYYGGTYGAQAAADALFGLTNPGGRLPVTVPRHSGQVPIYAAHHLGSSYHRTTQDLHQAYLDMPSTPLYPFGHGLSYTTFEYGELELERDTIPTDGEIVASVTVTNGGTCTGDEVVQLYASDTATGVTRPVRELVAFRRVGLEPGASTRVTFTVPLTQIGYVGLGGEFLIEPGPIRLMAGASSEDIRTEQTVQVTGGTRSLEGRRTFLARVEVSSAAPAAAAGV